MFNNFGLVWLGRTLRVNRTTECYGAGVKVRGNNPKASIATSPQHESAAASKKVLLLNSSGLETACSSAENSKWQLLERQLCECQNRTAGHYTVLSTLTPPGNIQDHDAMSIFVVLLNAWLHSHDQKHICNKGTEHSWPGVHAQNPTTKNAMKFPRCSRIDHGTIYALKAFTNLCYSVMHC